MKYILKPRETGVFILTCIVLGFVKPSCGLEIYVGRSLGGSKAVIASSKDFAAYDLRSGRSYVFRKNTGHTCAAEPKGSGIKIGNRVFPNGARLVRMSGGILVDGYYLRGSLEFLTGDKGAVVVREKIDIEEYLLGVLRAEMGSNWPLEAYRAQAVIARTYALKNSKAHFFGLCSGVHCQVYKPAERTDAVIYEAVYSTRGQVVMYRNELANTFFHACCGGSTADSADVWGGEFDYLSRTPCSYCKKAPHYSWSRFISSQQITGALVKMGYDVAGQKPSAVNAFETDSSGRARNLNFSYQGKKISVKASSFRLAAGPELLRSTKIRKITKQKDGFLFAGNGWGHGVGLCQWGARGMAESGSGYRSIIKKYYRGTKIKRL